jgi:glycosyltransferase involved in cell wall biosynthesis
VEHASETATTGTASDEATEPSLAGETIVCFAKDYAEDPTSNNHVMRALARDNRVLWLESIATRAPRLGRAGDLGKLGRKARAFLRGAREVEAGLHVTTPLVLPLPHSRLAARVNRRLLAWELGLARRHLGLARPQLWTFLPTAVRYLGALDESLVVYYCTDEWSALPGVDGARIARLEAELCARADVVFATARGLAERKRRLNPATYFAPHGVDHAHFRRALDPACPIAPELAGLPRPVLGFFGLLEEWVDLELLARAARLRPAWSFVLVGKEAVDTARLARLPNVHRLGRRSYASLPALCRGFDAALIPFVEDELTRHVNPIKLREYLSAGLPVVSTPLPEVVAAAAPGDCIVAGRAEGGDADGRAEAFVAACEAALAGDSAARRRERSARMSDQTWEARVRALAAPIRRALELRTRLH